MYNKVKFSLLLGKKCGQNLKVAGSLFVFFGNRNSQLVIGDHFHSLNGYNYNPLSRNIKGAFNIEKDGELIIGDWVGMSSVSIRCRSRIIIGDNVNIGADTIIIDSDAHSLNYHDRQRGHSPNLDWENTKSSPISIGDDVFIGARCIIMKGVTIGNRSIIGAGSVVCNNIPNDCVAAGNPCRIIKYLSK